MALVPFSVGFEDPFFTGIERAMDRAFARAFDNPALRSSSELVPSNVFRSVAGATPMDVHETDKEFTITADAPGFAPSEVSVEEHEGVLTVKGAKEHKKEDRDSAGNVLRQERVYRSFSRSFTLPPTAEPQKIHASLDRGVLTVHIPKMESAKPVVEPRRIPVVTSGTGAAPAQVEAAPPKKAN